MDEKDTCGAMILAAGQSQRMGDVHKLLAPLGDTPLIHHCVRQILAAGFIQPRIVLGARAAEMRAALSDMDVQFVWAADYHLGMAHSLAAAVRAAPAHWTSALICLGDMAFVNVETYRALRTHHADANSVVVPYYQGQRGNPVRWGRSYFEKLGALKGDVGGRALLDTATCIAWPCEDPAILQDIDTPADLAQAQAAYSSTTPPRNT